MKTFSNKIILPKIKFTSEKKQAKIFPEILTEQLSDIEYKLQFDGCSKSNPGIAGAGAVIYKFNKEISAKIQFVGNSSTNNAAEYTGLIIGLKEAINLGINKINVEGDSMLVIKQMSGEYQVKSKNLIDLYNEAKFLENKFEYISFKHIYRENNKRADELSNLAISKEHRDERMYYDEADEDEADEYLFKEQDKTQENS
jgi:ribonuclease HI